MKRFILILGISLLSIVGFSQYVITDAGNTIEYLDRTTLITSMDKQGLTCRYGGGDNIEMINNTRIVQVIPYSTVTTPARGDIYLLIAAIDSMLASAGNFTADTLNSNKLKVDIITSNDSTDIEFLEDVVMDSSLIVNDSIILKNRTTGLLQYQGVSSNNIKTMQDLNFYTSSDENVLTFHNATAKSLFKTQAKFYDITTFSDTIIFGSVESRLRTVSTGPGDFDMFFENTDADINFNITNGTFSILNRLTFDDTNCNLFLGDSAGVNISSTNNVIIGEGAGVASDADKQNVIIGCKAGYNFQDGNNCVLIGEQAGYNNTANSNVFIGRLAGYSNTTGTNNLFLGKETGRYHVTGDINTAFGNQCLRYDTDGYLNTVIGTNALQNAQETDSNTVVGAEILGAYDHVFKYNTLIGTRVASIMNQDMSGSVMIGYNVGNFNADLNNKLFIDNSNTTTPLIYGDFSVNTLTINGTQIKPTGTIADNDATPDVAGYNVMTYGGSSNSVIITDLDNPVIGAKYMIIGNSDTYMITINDGGNFHMSGGASFVLGNRDIIVFRCIADNDYIEISRSDN